MSEYQWPPFMSVDSPSPQSAYPDNHASWPMVDTWVEETHAFDDEYSAAYIHRDAARAWAGIAMWCSCLMDYRNWLKDWPPGGWLEDHKHELPFTIADQRLTYYQGWHSGNESAKVLTQRKMQTWQAFRDWLNGTPEQWQEIILQDDDMGPLTDCDMEDSYE